MSGKYHYSLVLLTETRHTFRHSFYHQILVLACQHPVLVTVLIFIYEINTDSLSRSILGFMFMNHQ